MQKISSIKKQIKLLLVTWSARTSYQTIPAISASTSKATKKFWKSATLALSILCLGLLYKRWISYNATETTMKYIVKEKIEFPAVTICDLQELRLSRDVINSSRVALTENSFDNGTIEWYLVEEPGQAKSLKKSYDLFRSFVSENLPNQSGFALEEALVSCELNLAECSASDFVSGDKRCWTLNKESNVSMPGVGYGLQLELFMQQIDSVARSIGYKIFVHENGTEPDLGSPGVLLSPGYATSIVITQVDSKRLSGCIKDAESLESMPTGLSQRTFTEFNHYSRATCTKLCNREQAELRSRNSTPTEDCRASCPGLCETSEFHLSSSYAIYPSGFYQAFAKEFFNLSVNVAVNVFYSDIGVYLVEEKEAQSMEQFIADIGGLLSLCIGAGIYTLLEVLVLSWEIVQCFFCRSSAAKVEDAAQTSRPSKEMMETTLRNTITKNRLKRLECEMRAKNQVLSRHEMDIKQLKAWMEEQKFLKE